MSNKQSKTRRKSRFAIKPRQTTHLYSFELLEPSEWKSYLQNITNLEIVVWIVDFNSNNHNVDIGTFRSEEEDNMELVLAMCEEIELQPFEPYHIQSTSFSIRTAAVRCKKHLFISKGRRRFVMAGLKDLDIDIIPLHKSLMNMDENIWTVDRICKLLKIIPTTYEQMAAQRKIKNPNHYGYVEQFFYISSEFDHLEMRLNLWMFKQEFNDICDALIYQYTIIGNACYNIGNNENIKTLLTIILAFGNHMNSGTRIGQIHAFDLKKLGEPSFWRFEEDGSRTLLMYIYEFCDFKRPKVLNILKELWFVLKIGSCINVDVLEKLYLRLQHGMKQIQGLICSDIENMNANDRFMKEISGFFRIAWPKMKHLNVTVRNARLLMKSVMKLFAYDSPEFRPKCIDSFIEIWWRFLQEFNYSKHKSIKLEAKRQKRLKINQLNWKRNTIRGSMRTLISKFVENRHSWDTYKLRIFHKLRGHIKQKAVCMVLQTKQALVYGYIRMYENKLDFKFVPNDIKQFILNLLGAFGRFNY
eukprot:433729_1